MFKSTGAYGGKRYQIPLELELQIAGSPLTSVLGADLQSSEEYAHG